MHFPKSILPALFLAMGTLCVAAPAAYADTSSLYAFEAVQFLTVDGPLASKGTDGFQVQFGLGYQFEDSLWAAELMARGGALYTGSNLASDGSSSYGTSTFGWGVSLKRFAPIHRNLQLYGRMGLVENFVHSNNRLAGFGLEYGAGIRASAKVRALGFLFFPAFFLGVGPKVTASVWLDLGGEVGNVHASHSRGAEEYSYRTSTGSIGWGVGGRF